VIHLCNAALTLRLGTIRRPHAVRAPARPARPERRARPDGGRDLPEAVTPRPGGQAVGTNTRSLSPGGLSGMAGCGSRRSPQRAGHRRPWRQS
jgi:hypothetical protein